MWTYYNLPFLLGEPGVETTEIPSITLDGAALRGLRAEFSPDIHTHCPAQQLYFDDDGLLRRHDYQVDVAGGTPRGAFGLRLRRRAGPAAPNAATGLPAERRRHVRNGQAARVGGPVRLRAEPVQVTRPRSGESDMTYTHATAPTQFVDVDGHSLRLPSLRRTEGRPLVFLQHFTGTMDFWDPTVIDGFARERPVILFDNVGVGSSSGLTPTTVRAMASDAVAFIAALGLRAGGPARVLAGWVRRASDRRRAPARRSTPHPRRHRA